MPPDQIIPSLMRYEIAEAYGWSVEKLRREIAGLGLPRGKRYTPAQVRQIVEHLGPPPRPFPKV